MRKLLFYFLLFACCFVQQSFGQNNNTYNIIWNTQSENASGSMPCGGGDIGMNLWVEKGELLVYVCRSGSLNEDNNLMKSGRLRFTLSPNPFDGKMFKQELHLQEGYVTVEGENNGVKATATIWVDVNRPVAHFDITANKKINVEAAYESWRYKERLLTKRESFSNSWKWGAPKDKTYSNDEISFTNGGVLFYHNNGPKTVFDTTVTQQGLAAFKNEMYNPLKNLAFGGVFTGNGFYEAGTGDGKYEETDFKSWKLKSRQSAKQHNLQLVLHTEQVSDFGNWLGSLKKTMAVATDKTAFAQTKAWWQQYWSRSFIQIDPLTVNSDAWKIGRNYQLFRYMLGCNARGFWPTKFNGGLFTVDPLYSDNENKGLTPDYRNWGGGVHTAQNQRLVYFPMIKSGDWDLLQSQLNFYLRIQKNAELRSKVYWNHGGACFTEQMENFGLPNYAEYGIKRPDDYDKGVEYNAWLEYEWDTVLEFCLMMLEENRYTGKDISDKVPFIESCLKFFDEHYQYLARKRGIKVTDQNGHLVLYPGSAGETFKMAVNATSTIAALQTVAARLSDYVRTTSHGNDTANDNVYYYLQAFLKRIPPISFTSINGHTTIAPARSWERINNQEQMQLYPVFPWGLYGVGKPGLDTALNTWKYDTFVLKVKNHISWKQDNIWTARLGLTDEAWDYAVKKLSDGPTRFPAFWGPGYDWRPDHNWGGSAMIGLQEMLMQVDDKRILLFPAWPKDKDVHFKLHAPYNTTVEAEWKNGKLEMLKVMPEERKKDVEMMMK